jgi:hypothetical protein
MSRREFPPSVIAEIKRRARRPTGFQCEATGCGLIVSYVEAHHIDQDAMQIDKSRKLTAKDGLALCERCHDAITAAQAGVLAKVKRQENNELRTKPAGVGKMQSQGFRKFKPVSRNSLDGERIAKPALPKRNPFTGESYDDETSI